MAERTVREIANEAHVTARQVSYAALVASVKPSRWAGPARLFDTAAVRRIKAKLAEIATNPGPHRTVAQPSKPIDRDGKRSA